MTFNSITREEYYLAKMAGLYDGNTPKPILRAEYYLARACGDYDGDLPVPITRYDKYLARIAGENISVPDPILRIEHFLLAVIGDVDYKNLPIPITRKEKLLYEIVKSDDYTLVTKKGKGQIIATGTMDGVPFEQIIMQGWTKQETTTGAQLFDKSRIVDNTILDSSGAIAPSKNYMLSGFIEVKPNTVYSRTYMNVNETALYNSDKTFVQMSIAGSKIQTINNIRYIRFNIPKTVDINTLMVNEGASILPYEPYTDRYPSPRPQMRSKNLANPDDIVIGELASDTGLELAANNRIRTGYIPVIAGASYKYRAIYVVSNAHMYNTDKTRVGSYSSSVPVPEGVAYIRMSFGKNDNSDFTDDDLANFKNTFMINKGETVLPYEPYSVPEYPQEIASAGLYDNGKYKINLTIADGSGKRQNVLLTSDHPLTKWDRLEKRDGVWGWVCRSATRKLSEFNINLSTGENPNGRVFRCADEKINSDNFISHYRKTEHEYTSQLDDGEFLSAKGIVYICDSSSDTAEEFKLHAAENNILVTSELIEPVFLPLSETEQLALNALATYYPTTVISNSQDCEMEVTYKTKHI